MLSTPLGVQLIELEPAKFANTVISNVSPGSSLSIEYKVSFEPTICSTASFIDELLGRCARFIISASSGNDRSKFCPSIAMDPEFNAERV
ncbi:hypothetical protein D3C81_2166140 [compost metagenome]